MELCLSLIFKGSGLQPREIKLPKSELFAFPDTTVRPILPNPTRKYQFRKPSNNVTTVAMETDGEVMVDSSDEEGEYSNKQPVYSRRSRALATVVKGRKFDHIRRRIQSERLIDVWNSDG